MNEPTDKPQEAAVDRAWNCGWEEHRQQQLLHWARLPLEAKLEWLEEAEEIAMNLAASRKAQQRDADASVPKDV